MLNAVDLLIAIRARLKASAPTQAREVYSHRAARGVVVKANEKPFIVVNIRGDANDSFTSNGLDVQVFVNIFDHRANASTQLSDLWARVIGDGNPPDTAPTYGLHRHHLVLATDNTAGVMVFEGFEPILDDDEDGIGVVLRFNVNMDYVPPAP